jgi:hypothetical protein
MLFINHVHQLWSLTKLNIGTNQKSNHKHSHIHTHTHTHLGSTIRLHFVLLNVSIIPKGDLFKTLIILGFINLKASIHKTCIM